ncbi:MAG TPA: hypothetical protein VL172_19335 [Kofleriaceae bacterium]|jgi:hypothetical protein|nr:hypothetical protein [Kofleriaceae bacterium]
MNSRVIASALLLFIGACGGDDGGGGDVTIIRGAPDQADWLDLTIDATAVDAAEGTPVLVQIGIPDRAPERLGSAELAVEGGGFHVTFPDVWELGLYKQKVVVIDNDGDGGCGAGDSVRADFSAGLEDTTLTWANLQAADCELYVADWPTE